MAVNIPIVSSFSGKGFDKAITQFKKLTTTADKAEFIMRKLGGPALLAGIGALTTELGLAVKAAAEDQQSQEQLRVSLENTVGASSAQVAAVESSVKALMLQTATADTVLRPALTRLVRATGDVAKAQSLLKVAVDISAGSGKDLESVTLALSKAAMGNFTALKRLGIPLDQNAVKAKNLDAIVQSLGNSFAGAATAKANTFEGQLKLLKIEINEIQKDIGYKLLPVLTDYAKVLSHLIAPTDQATTSTKSWTRKVIEASIATIPFIENIKLALFGVDKLNAAVHNQALAFGQNTRASSRVTNAAKEAAAYQSLLGAKIDVTTTATSKGTSSASKHAAALKKIADAAAKLKKDAADAAQAVKDKLTQALDDATVALDKAQGKFDAFHDLVGSAITASFSFGDAQSQAATNADELKTALAKQAAAQIKVNEAYDKWSAFQDKDNMVALVQSQEELAAATNDVAAAQAKPMTFFDSLAIQAQKAKDFGVLVNRLIAAGLSDAALQQVLSAGVESGTAIATTILDSADGVLKANELTQSMTDLADQVGKNAASKYYAAGVAAATAYLKGIQETLGLVMPDVNPASIDLSGFSVGGLPTMMASGGIVTGPTSIIAGEAGPEAIIPLSQMGNMGLGGGMNITVQAGLVSTPDQIGQDIILAIQKAQRRSGQVFANATGVAV
jgi:hypothetical protein